MTHTLGIDITPVPCSKCGVKMSIYESQNYDENGPEHLICPKHNPDCDCGICQYCQGDEDKFGTSLRLKFNQC